MKTITVNASKNYEVRIENGLLQKVGEQLLTVKNACTAVLVSDETVFSLYGEAVQKSMQNAGFAVKSFVIKPGEASKSTATLVQLWEFLAESGITRSDLLVALGGGVCDFLMSESVIPNLSQHQTLHQKSGGVVDR